MKSDQLEPLQEAPLSGVQLAVHYVQWLAKLKFNTFTRDFQGDNRGVRYNQ